MPSGIVEAKFEHAGYCCVVVQHASHRCGYVGVPKKHPLYGKEGGDPVPGIKSDDMTEVEVGDRGAIPLLLYFMTPTDTVPVNVYFDVHGGITYTGGDGDYPIYTETPIWWFGFDCHHADDDLETCDTEFVRRNCCRLADQLAIFESGEPTVITLAPPIRLILNDELN